jgi:hypothetical protein
MIAMCFIELVDYDGMCVGVHFLVREGLMGWPLLALADSRISIVGGFNPN